MAQLHTATHATEDIIQITYEKDPEKKKNYRQQQNLSPEAFRSKFPTQ